MQTKPGRYLSSLIVCSLLIGMTAGFTAAQAPAPAAKPKAVKPTPPADPNAILKVIPANATAFVAVRNIAEVDFDVSEVLDKLQLPLAEMGFPGLLDMIKERAGITKGLNANSGAAIALLDCSKLKTTDELEKRAVILLPTDDAEALAKAMGGNKQGDGYQLTLNNEPAVGTEKAGFLIIAATEAKDALKEIAQAKEGIEKTLSGDRLKAYGNSDVFGWANLRGFSPELRAEPLNALKGMMMLSAPAGGAKEVDESLSGVGKFLDDLKEASFAATLDAKVGLKLAFWYRAMPDSDMAKRLQAAKLSDGSLLAGLPDESAIFAAGMVNTTSPDEIQKALDRSIKPELLGKEVDEAQAKALKESLTKLLTSVERVSVSVAGLPSEGEDGMVGVTFVVRTANSQQAQAELRKLFSTVKDLLIKTAVAKGELTEEQSKSANEAIQLKENAEKLTGAVVDHFVVDLAKLPDADEEMVKQIRGVVGQEGILVRIAQVGDKNLAVTFGGGAKRFAQIVDLIQKNQAPLADRKTVKMVADRLPGQKKIAEGYLSVDRLLALVMEMSSKLGQPVPLPLTMKETAPLSVVAAQVDESSATIDVLVPIELAQSAAEMAKPMMMMMMGGMPGPGETAPGEEGEKEEEKAPAPVTPPVR
jgi:hypothetical protein